MATGHSVKDSRRNLHNVKDSRRNLHKFTASASQYKEVQLIYTILVSPDVKTVKQLPLQMLSFIPALYTSAWHSVQHFRVYIWNTLPFHTISSPWKGLFSRNLTEKTCFGVIMSSNLVTKPYTQAHTDTHRDTDTHTFSCWDTLSTITGIVSMAFKTFFRCEVHIHDELLTDLVNRLTGKNVRSTQFNSYRENIIIGGRKKKSAINTLHPYYQGHTENNYKLCHLSTTQLTHAHTYA